MGPFHGPGSLPLCIRCATFRSRLERGKPTFIGIKTLGDTSSSHVVIRDPATCALEQIKTGVRRCKYRYRCFGIIFPSSRVGGSDEGRAGRDFLQAISSGEKKCIVMQLIHSHKESLYAFSYRCGRDWTDNYAFTG